jgi:1-phosphatidylinositol-4-phosphate 5-kinase
LSPWFRDLASLFQFLGIIDILTPYSLTKKLEHTFKTLVFSKEAISAVNPTDYARRFLRFMSGNILQNVGADYSRRSLPLPPEADESLGEAEGVEGGEGRVLCLNEKDELKARRSQG